jgi:hypothetical protein
MTLATCHFWDLNVTWMAITINTAHFKLYIVELGTLKKVKVAALRGTTLLANTL